jgi:hypothetical protein
VLEHRPAVEADARDAHHGELDDEHVALLAVGVVAGGTLDGAHGAVGKRLGIEARGVQRRAVVPQTDGVLGGHVELLLVGARPDYSAASRSTIACSTNHEGLNRHPDTGSGWPTIIPMSCLARFAAP